MLKSGLSLNRSRQVPAEESAAFGGVAERFRRAGDLDRAIALCQEGLKKFPGMLSARVTLGWALLDKGKYEEARVELEQVLKRAPDNLAAIRGLAELHDRTELGSAMEEHAAWQPMQEADAVADPGAAAASDLEASAASMIAALDEPLPVPVIASDEPPVLVSTSGEAVPMPGLAASVAPSDESTMAVSAASIDGLLDGLAPQAVEEFSVEAPPAPPVAHAAARESSVEPVAFEVETSVVPEAELHVAPEAPAPVARVTPSGNETVEISTQELEALLAEAEATEAAEEAAFQPAAMATVESASVETEPAVELVPAFDASLEAAAGAEAEAAEILAELGADLDAVAFAEPAPAEPPIETPLAVEPSDDVPAAAALAIDSPETPEQILEGAEDAEPVIEMPPAVEPVIEPPIYEELASEMPVAAAVALELAAAPAAIEQPEPEPQIENTVLDFVQLPVMEQAEGPKIAPLLEVAAPVGLDLVLESAAAPVIEQPVAAARALRPEKRPLVPLERLLRKIENRRLEVQTGSVA